MTNLEVKRAWVHVTRKWCLARAPHVRRLPQIPLLSQALSKSKRQCNGLAHGLCPRAARTHPVDIPCGNPTVCKLVMAHCECLHSARLVHLINLGGPHVVPMLTEGGWNLASPSPQIAVRPSARAGLRAGLRTPNEALLRLVAVRPPGGRLRHDGMYCMREPLAGGAGARLTHW